MHEKMLYIVTNSLKCIVESRQKIIKGGYAVSLSLPILTSPFLSQIPPFPHIDIIRAVVIVWKVRGKIIRLVS